MSENGRKSKETLAAGCQELVRQWIRGFGVCQETGLLIL